MVCFPTIIHIVLLFQDLYTWVPEMKWPEDEGLARYQVTSRTDPIQNKVTAYSTIHSHPALTCLSTGFLFLRQGLQSECKPKSDSEG